MVSEEGNAFCGEKIEKVLIAATADSQRFFALFYMTPRLSAISAAFVAAACFAPAAVVTTGGTTVAGQGVVSSVAGAFNVNFNGGSAPASGAAIYAGGTVQTGSNAAGTALAGNTSAYLTIGPIAGATVTIDFAEPMQYFGFNTGSLDVFNRIQFLAGSTVVLDRTGTSFGAAQYVNVFAVDPAEFFTRIILTSTNNAFETDNHAFRSVVGAITQGDLPDGIGGIFVNGGGPPVPEPATWACLVSALGALACFRRRK